MAKFPYMATRKGSKNLFYKRAVPKNLQAVAGKKQVRQSLGTDDIDDAKAVAAGPVLWSTTQVKGRAMAVWCRRRQ